MSGNGRAKLEKRARKEKRCCIQCEWATDEYNQVTDA